MTVRSQRGDALTSSSAPASMRRPSPSVNHSDLIGRQDFSFARTTFRHLGEA
jgi:hypothetical protein